MDWCDCHIYSNHMEQVNQQLERRAMTGPTLQMPAFNTLEELISTKPTDYILNGYDPMSSIKADMAV